MSLYSSKVISGGRGMRGASLRISPPDWADRGPMLIRVSIRNMTDLWTDAFMVSFRNATYRRVTKTY
jgi:hypothetical protein